MGPFIPKDQDLWSMHLDSHVVMNEDCQSRFFVHMHNLYLPNGFKCKSEMFEVFTQKKPLNYFLLVGLMGFFKIFHFFKWKFLSKLINYSTNMCRSCQGTMVVRFAWIAWCWRQHWIMVQIFKTIFHVLQCFQSGWKCDLEFVKWNKQKYF